MSSVAWARASVATPPPPPPLSPPGEGGGGGGEGGAGARSRGQGEGGTGLVGGGRRARRSWRGGRCEGGKNHLGFDSPPPGGVFVLEKNQIFFKFGIQTQKKKHCFKDKK